MNKIIIFTNSRFYEYDNYYYTLYNLALSFLLTAGHDTDSCRKNGI